MRFIRNCLILSLTLTAQTFADVPDATLDSAGDNKSEITKALAEVPKPERAGMEFLISNMPERDLTSLSAKYLLDNTRLAYESKRNDTWSAEVPEDVFLNFVLPYASVNEQRDEWRADFRKRFLPLVKDAKSTSEAAAILNNKIYKELNVRYSTKRRRADQGPLESIESGLASCTGLSILLIDACRSVGVPARFVGTPRWSNNSGNHSWVEIWDDGWHFTGAAEPTGDDLDKGWFVNNATKAQRDNPRYAIYAATFDKKSPLHFPCVWARRVKDIPGINVTDRYTRLKEQPKEGYVDNLVLVKNAAGERVRAQVCVLSGDHKEPFCQGLSNDEGFDSNDHFRVSLKKGEPQWIRVTLGKQVVERKVTPEKADELVVFALAEAGTIEQVDSAVLQSLHAALDADTSMAELADKDFARKALTKLEIEQARDALQEHLNNSIRKDRKEEMEAKSISLDGKTMPFFYKSFGEKPDAGWSLYISMHGGGGAPARVNDRQYENQKRLYQLEEGIYLAPRAPTNTWNLWHEGHIDKFFVRLIENMVAFEGVDPNRVYIMGYSAGGDGVFQLAPRMSDRWAAAAMMAGHPNETVALGLRNLPFALQMGGRDAAYDRNEKARAWEKELAKLREQDPEGYKHFVKIYPEKGHWMDGEDKIAIPWMAKYTRNATPKKIVWKQDDVTHSHFYWLAVDEENEVERSEVTAEVEGQTITVSAKDIKKLQVDLDDRFIDLDKPIKIISGEKTLFEGRVKRNLNTLIKTISARGDANLSYASLETVRP